MQLHSNCHTTPLKDDSKVKAIPQHPPALHTLVNVEKPQRGTMSIDNEGSRHHRTKRVAAMQDSSPWWRCNKTHHSTEWTKLDPGHSQTATQSPPRQHNARAPRRFRRWTPPLTSPQREQCARWALPYPPHTPCPGSISEVDVEVVSKDALLPQVCIKQPSRRRGFDFTSLLYPRI